MRASLSLVHTSMVATWPNIYVFLMKAKAKYKFWDVLANMLVSDKFWQIFFCINVKNWLSLNARGLIWKLAVCSLVGWTRRNFTIYDVWLASVRWLYERKKRTMFTKYALRTRFSYDLLWNFKRTLYFTFVTQLYNVNRDPTINQVCTWLH